MKEFFIEFVIALVVFALMMGGIYAYGQHEFNSGQQTERAEWLARDNEQLTTANAKIKTLEEQYRQQEQDAALALNVISHQYQEDLRNVKAEKDRILAGLRDGTYRLRIPVARAFTAFGNPASAVAAAASGCDGEARAELSGSASEFLVGLASEADEVAKQLGRCQEVVKADREACKGESDGGE